MPARAAVDLQSIETKLSQIEPHPIGDGVREAAFAPEGWI
jgi:hypothetical protein